MTRLALILAAALLAAPAVAEAPATCFPLAVVSSALAKGHGERPSAGGVLSGGKGTLLVWANPDTGTWTAAVVTTTGVACVIGSGEGWEAAGPQPEGRAS